VGTTEAARFSLQSARDAAQRGEIARWVGDFLASRGSDNAVLAAALAQRPHSWCGPLEVPVDRLVRLAGPEPDALCKVEPSEWEHDVERMAEQLEDGWEAPPLLAELRDGELLLQDGNHRYEALVREGASHAWVVVWCDDDETFEQFVASITPPRSRGDGAAARGSSS
jgi:hypothetical protein